MHRLNLLVAILLVCSCTSSSLGSVPTAVRDIQAGWEYVYGVSVFWSSPLDWGEPQYNRYDSFYVSKLYLGTEFVKRTEFSSSSTDRALSELNPNSTYTFSIAARNPEGEGPFTNVTFTTSEYGMPSKVRNFRPATYGTSFAIFTWDEPQFDGNYPISNYSYRCSQQTWAVSGNVPASNKFFTINNLQQQYVYYCNVVAWNDFGEGLPMFEYDSFMFIPLSGYVDKIENVTVNTITTNSAHIVWDVPLSTFELNYYIVSYYDKTNVVYLQQFVTDNQVTLTGLASATDYVVRVKAVDVYTTSTFSITSDGDQNSDPVSFTTPHYICPDD